MQSYKKEIREKVKKLFKIKEKSLFERENKFLLHTICEHTKIKTCQKIGIYISQEDEVDTKKLIDTLFSLWKTLFIPFIEGEKMYFSEIKKDSLFISWAYWVQEPKKKLVSKENIEVFIVPWRAFSDDGVRIWRGKWYYDTFFSWEKHKNAYKIGIAYSFQIFSSLPRDNWDIMMNEVIFIKKQ